MKYKGMLAILAASSMLAACNKEVKNVSQDFNALPPAVQKTARAQAPNDEIVSVSNTTTNGAQAYEIKFREGNSNPVIVVAADGTLLSTDLPREAGAVKRFLTPTGSTSTPLSALPEKVQATIQANAPNAPIASITRHDNNGRTVYEVEFQDQGKNPTIQVAEDGTMVQGLKK